MSLVVAALVAVSAQPAVAAPPLSGKGMKISSAPRCPSASIASRTVVAYAACSRISLKRTGAKWSGSSLEKFYESLGLPWDSPYEKFYR